MYAYGEDIPANGKVFNTFKAAGSAANSIAKNELPSGKPIAMALHTRAYTLGNPLNNDNNHPVYHDGVWVTHNGSINNDLIIRDTFAAGEDLPDVDSIVFPIMLSALAPNPTDHKAVEQALDVIAKGVEGAYTFHAMWENYPDYSLIAIGEDRPLVFAYHEDKQVFMYASQKDALAAIVQRMGIKINETALLTGELEEGNAILFHKGVPVMHHELPIKALEWARNARYPTLQRVTPSGAVIEDNKGTQHWLSDFTPWSTKVMNEWQWENRITDLLSKEGLTLIAGSQNHTAKSVAKMLPDVTAAYVFKQPSVSLGQVGVLYFLWFGEHEMVLSHIGNMLALYDWSRYGDENMPWQEVPIPHVDVSDFSAWLTLVSKELVLTRPVAITPKPAKVVHTTSSLSLKEVELVRHKDAKGLVFFSDPRCQVHNGIFFSAHPKPWDCPLVMTFALAVLTSAEDLDDMTVLYPECELEITGNQLMHQHVWNPAIFQGINYNGSMKGSFVIAEDCESQYCGAIRGFKKDPDLVLWLESKGKAE